MKNKFAFSLIWCFIPVVLILIIKQNLFCRPYLKSWSKECFIYSSTVQFQYHPHHFLQILKGELILIMIPSRSLTRNDRHRRPHAKINAFQMLLDIGDDVVFRVIPFACFLRIDCRPYNLCSQQHYVGRTTKFSSTLYVFNLKECNMTYSTQTDCLFYLIP